MKSIFYILVKISAFFSKFNFWLFDEISRVSRITNVQRLKHKMNKPGENKNDQQEKRKKESILELTKFLEKSIRVKFAGGREASGILKGKKFSR